MADATVAADVMMLVGAVAQLDRITDLGGKEGAVVE